MIKSPIFFIVKPLDGDRYKDSKKFGNSELLMNASLDNPLYTNRLAEVVELPMMYEGDVEVGDLLVVHHNTFRLMRTQMGSMVSSMKHIIKDLYWVDDYFIHINKNGKASSRSPYLFLKPSQESSIFYGNRESKNKGVIKYTNDKLSELGFKEGEEFAFKNHRDYRFNLFGEDYFKMDFESILIAL